MLCGAIVRGLGSRKRGGGKALGTGIDGLGRGRKGGKAIQGG